MRLLHLRGDMILDAASMDRPVDPSVRNSRRTVIILIAAAVALIATVALYPLVHRWASTDRAVDSSTMRIATVTRGDLQRDVSVQGKVVASLHPTIFSPAQGIVALRTRAGSVVRKGDVLAIIESSDLRSQLEQARASLQSMQTDVQRQRIAARQTRSRGSQEAQLARVRVEAAKRSLDRAKTTFEQGVSTRSELERATDELRVASLELEQAEKDLTMNGENGDFETKSRELLVARQASIVAELEKRVAELTVKAPFDGMVANLPVQDRDAIATNQPVVTIVDLSSYELEIAVPEEYADDTVIGTKAAIQVGGREYNGHVTAISPEVTSSQVTGTVAFDGETPTGLKQNQRVPTRIIFDSKKNALKLPRGAFFESGGGRVAYVVKDGVATRREVKFGVASASEVEILSGLEEGDRVIVSDTTPLQNSDKVLLQ